MPEKKPKLNFDHKELLEKYHHPDFAMTYGSEVFTQEGSTDKDKPMVDIVFGLANSQEWHQKNLQENSQDYSWIARTLRSKFITWLQKTGAGIYYIPNVPFGDINLKYGTMDSTDLVNDLEDWTNLYAAGQLQKPVHILSSTDRIDMAIKNNLRNALNVALMILPEEFPEEDLFNTIAGISYTGNIRMKVGENPNKIQDIVGKDIEDFKKLYREAMDIDSNIVALKNGKIRQNKVQKVTKERFEKAPLNLGRQFKQLPHFENPTKFRQELQQAISKIVNP